MLEQQDTELVESKLLMKRLEGELKAKEDSVLEAQNATKQRDESISRMKTELSATHNKPITQRMRDALSESVSAAAVGDPVSGTKGPLVLMQGARQKGNLRRRVARFSHNVLDKAVGYFEKIASDLR